MTIVIELIGVAGVTSFTAFEVILMVAAGDGGKTLATNGINGAIVIGAMAELQCVRHGKALLHLL